MSNEEAMDRFISLPENTLLAKLIKVNQVLNMAFSESCLQVLLPRFQNLDCCKLELRFYHEVSTPVQGVCHSLKRFGGRWRPKEQVTQQTDFL